ncbi:MAG: hypothetical protein NZM18_05850 [Thermoflexales bacterium]|nr:hypothetical protein [Thermoflexales bacterium]
MAHLKRIAPYLVVLFGFAMRMYAMDTTWIDGDRANPHGMALLLVYQLSQGQLTDLLLFADDASTGIPNGPIVNYIWAIVSLFERSLLSATALGLMANTLVIAVVYALGRRCFGWMTAIFAATLSAASNWGVYLARGVWHPGQVEISVVATACLLATGVHAQHTRALRWGFVGALLTAGHYFGAMVMPFQAAVATLVAGAWRPALRKAWAIGFGISLAGLTAFVLAMILAGRLSLASLAGLNLFRSEGGALTEADLIARDITPFNRDPIGHFLRLASNRDYALVWTSPQVQAYAVREPLTQALAWLVTVFIGVGLLRMTLHWRQPAIRFLLVWAALPIIALALIAAWKRDFRIPVYYLLLTTPTMYIAGGYGLAALAQRLHLRTVGVVALCAALCIVPAWNFSAAAETTYRQALISPGFMPLRWSLRLSRLWQQECALINGSNFWWDLSLIQSPERWRPNGTRFNEFSSIWTFPPRGGTCALKQTGAPLPHGELLPLVLEDGSVVRTYRALPYSLPARITNTVNLGWSLLEFDAPTAAAPGDTIHIRHAWRVDALPGEPYHDWYFAPFVKLTAPDGRVVVDVDRAVALLGHEWRVGEVQMSDIRITLPNDLPVGIYTLRSSLFDPNQKKNAVYFATHDPGTPILSLDRKIQIAHR